jgi:hypothetical protein
MIIASHLKHPKRAKSSQLRAQSSYSHVRASPAAPPTATTRALSMAGGRVLRRTSFAGT